MTDVSLKRVLAGTGAGLLVYIGMLLVLLLYGCSRAEPLRPTFDSKECPGLRVEILKKGSGCRNVVSGKYVDENCCAGLEEK